MTNVCSTIALLLLMVTNRVQSVAVCCNVKGVQNLGRSEASWEAFLTTSKTSNYGVWCERGISKYK